MVNNETNLGFAQVLNQILEHAQVRGFDQRALAARAGIAPETLSRMKKRQSADFSTIDRLARVVGLKLSLVPDDETLQSIREGSFF